MSFTFLDLQTEVKARALLQESGTGYDTTIKNTLNTSLFRLARECPWRVLRRSTSFDTEIGYTTGTGAVAVTLNSKNVTVTGATFLTNNIQIGRRVALGGSTKVFHIATVTGETTFTVDVAFDGTTSTTQTYKIYGREEYNLPLQAGRIGLLWHEDYGYPYIMNYITDKDFYGSGITPATESTPMIWRQWGANSVLEQPLQASVMRVYSSDSSDVSKNITIYGQVSGYPDFETITTNASNGTTAVSGSKSFTTVERVVKDSTTAGRITVDCNSANTTVSVLPVGDTAGTVEYLKVQVYPLATRVFPVNVEFYKDPWRLVSDNDMHELGHQFDEALILLTTSKLNYAQGKKDDGDKHFALYRDEVSSLRKQNSDTILNWTPSLRPARTSRMSGTGSKYLSFAQIGTGGSFGPIWGS